MVIHTMHFFEIRDYRRFWAQIFQHPKLVIYSNIIASLTMENYVENKLWMVVRMKHFTLIVHCATFTYGNKWIKFDREQKFSKKATIMSNST